MILKNDYFLKIFKHENLIFFLEKLDATIAEFEGQEASRRLSLHADDPKIASIRGSHTVKRVSVVDYESLMSGEPSNARGGDHVSPAEARIKKYHKKSASQVKVILFFFTNLK